MKNILLIISFLFTSGLFAQGIYNNGGKIVIGSGASLNISGTGGNYRNETNVTNGSIDLSGTLLIAGNVTNNVTGADILAATSPGSLVVLNGTTAQSIGGTTTSSFLFPNLTIKNANGVVISKNALVNGNMTFTNGLVDIGNNNFVFGSSAVVAGTPSSASMIISTGTGQVQKNWTSTGAFTFPVGDNNVTAKYSPVTLTFTGGTFAAGAFTGLNLINAKYNDPSITGSYLNRCWNLSQTGISAFACNAMFQYLPSDVVGTETSINSLMVSPLPMTVFAAANTTLHQLSATGLTSFGTFTGALGSRTLNLKLFLEGLYNNVNGVMNYAQGLSQNQFPGTTVDQITVELHDTITYANMLYSIGNVNLSTTGSATVNIPANFGNYYYVAVKNRNSITTITTKPIAFTNPIVNYDFTTSLTHAFGSNMKTVKSGVFGFYGGDANGDGSVDVLDIIAVQNDVKLFSSGYLLTDLNGDGAIDVLDLILAQNNAKLFISIFNP